MPDIFDQIAPSNSVTPKGDIFDEIASTPASFPGLGHATGISAYKPSLGERILGSNYQPMMDALFSSKNPVFSNVNQNPQTPVQGLVAGGQNLVNSLATPGSLALMAVGVPPEFGPTLPTLGSAGRLAYGTGLAGGVVAPLAQSAGVLSPGSGASLPERTEASVLPLSIIAGIAAKKGYDLGYGNADNPAISEWMKLQPQRELTLDELNARANFVKEQQPKQSSVAPVPPPKAATAPVVSSVDATSVPKSKLASKPAVATVVPSNQGGTLGPVQQAAKEPVVQPQTLNPVIENLAKKVADPTAGRLSPAENQFLSQISRQNPQLHQAFLGRVAQLQKEASENKPAAVGTGSPQVVEGQAQQQKGLAPQVPIQSAPQEKIPGGQSGVARADVSRNVQGGGGVTSNPLAPSTVVKGVNKLGSYGPSIKKVKTEALFQQLGINPKVGSVPFAKLTQGQLMEKRRVLQMVFKNLLNQSHPDKVSQDPVSQKAAHDKFVNLIAAKNELEGRLTKRIQFAPTSEGNVVKGAVQKLDRTGPESGALFPESPVSKAVKETGATEGTPKLVEDAHAKLDSLKAFGSQIFDAVTDQHMFKSWMLKRQGYDLPKIEALNPGFANMVAKYANSQVASVLRAHANITKVLGDKANNEQFRKQLGGLIYEDMRRASGGIGNPVFKLKNSPFANEQQYQAALKNPEFQKALAAWKQHIQPLATEMHEKLGGSLAESGQQTGAFANLIAILRDDKIEQVENAPSTVGPLATMKRGSAFSKERKFTGEEYNLDAGNMAFRMLTKNAQQAALRDVYSEGEKAGLLKLLKPGDETPAGMIRQQNPVTLRSLIQDGENVNVSRWLAFDKRISPTLKQALQLNTSWKEALKEGAPALHVASQAIIKTQVGLGIDLGFHTFNDMVAVANSPKGLLALPLKALQVAKAQHDIVSNSPEIQEELAKAAEAGVTFRGESLGGWSSHALKIADTVTRVVLNREFDSLVKDGTVKDIPAERRRYINGRAGQYNKRFMTWFQQGMQETGLGSFNVAGRNFNRLAVGNLTMSPGVKAASNLDALRLRLSIAVGIATAALIIPATVNKMTTGSTRPEGTEFGDIVLHKNKDGSYEVINMWKWTMLYRGARASGVGAVMREQVMPRIRGEQPASIGQTAYDAMKDIGRTAVAPFSGPPLNLLSVGLTGRTEGGLGYEQRTPGEKPPYFQAMLGQLNPLVGPLVQNQQANSPMARVGQRLGSVVGVQASQAPFSIIRNRATQWKQSNNIRTDEASFAPSEYLPLKQALLVGDMDKAKEQYQQLLSEKANQHPSLSDDEAKHEAQMDLQKEFSKLENFRFVNKENEDKFKASLSPEQRKMYDNAVAQQKQIADSFFSQLQAKIDSKAPRGFKPPTMRKARGFSQQF
jgi:hypothetical protein